MFCDINIILFVIFFRIKPLVENSLREIVVKEKELSTLLPKGLDEDNFHAIQSCR